MADAAENENQMADGGLAPTEGNDDGIVGGPRTPQQIAAQRRLQQTQAQVDEVKTKKNNKSHKSGPIKTNSVPLFRHFGPYRLSIL